MGITFDLSINLGMIIQLVVLLLGMVVAFAVVRTHVTELRESIKKLIPDVMELKGDVSYIKGRFESLTAFILAMAKRGEK